MTTCKGSRTSLRFSTDRLLLPAKRMFAATSCIWHRTVHTRPRINSTVSALRFFFDVTLDRADLARQTSFVHEPRKLPVVLSPHEVARLLEAAPGIKYKAALSVAYNEP